MIYHGTRPRALRYTGGWTSAPPRRQPITAKLSKLWEGLQEGRPSGTYIRPHTDGTYEFGRWSHGLVGHYKFTRIGERPTMDACREALEADDKAHERRTKQLNTRSKRRA